ncbi:MAG: phosphoribosyl-ATP diphosphatase [Spirochaetales bacterium]|nr:phosphoribosyl-ATP diphosphatase [Spirochaetales bacterium]
MIACALINDKGYAKSRERGELWTLDGSTGRLLPWVGGGQIVGLSQEGGWAAAVVEGAVLPEESEETQTSPPNPGPETLGGVESSDSLPDASRILGDLEQLILSRKTQMPEGSYTTHLFEKGEDKIRKKAGEEAIELLLARSDEELVSETADFLYHLLVLFAEKNIPFRQVLRELGKR